MILLAYIHILNDLSCEYQNNYQLLDAQWKNGSIFGWKVGYFIVTNKPKKRKKKKTKKTQRNTKNQEYKRLTIRYYYLKIILNKI